MEGTTGDLEFFFYRKKKGIWPLIHSLCSKVSPCLHFCTSNIQKQKCYTILYTTRHYDSTFYTNNFEKYLTEITLGWVLFPSHQHNSFSSSLHPTCKCPRKSKDSFNQSAKKYFQKQDHVSTSMIHRRILH